MILAATGHRSQDLGGFSVDASNYLIDVAKTALHQLQPKHVITGMALGWDQAIAHAAIELVIPFTAALPFKHQACKWPKLSRLIHKRLLEEANDVVICSDGDYETYKMHKRNEWMVDNADAVLALWSGKDTGGTYSCIKYALQRNKPVHNAYSIYTGDIEELIKIGAL